MRIIKKQVTQSPWKFSRPGKSVSTLMWSQGDPALGGRTRGPAQLGCPCDAANQPSFRQAEACRWMSPCAHRTTLLPPVNKAQNPLQRELFLNYKLFTSGNDLGVLHFFKASLAEKYTTGEFKSF